MSTDDPDGWARWVPARGTWTAGTVSAACGHPPPWRDPWPVAGAVRSGRAVALDPPERPADASALPLLPTPSVGDATGGHISRSGARRRELLLGGIVRSWITSRVVSAGQHTPSIKSNFKFDNTKGCP